MGDGDTELGRYMGLPPEMDMDLWLLYHRDLKRIARVHVFRDFLASEFKNFRDLLEGSLAQRNRLYI